MTRAQILFLLLSVLKVTLSAKILGIAPSPSYSHQIVYNEIWKELSLRGHQVVVITTDPIGNKSLVNLTEIDVHFSYDLKRKMNQELLKANYGPLGVTKLMAKYQEDLFEAHLQHPDVKALLTKNDDHFDLVVFEYYLIAYSYFAKKFECPYIGVLSIDLPTEYYGVLGNPLHPAVYSSMMFPFYKDLTFTERLLNFVYGFYAWYIWSIFNESSDRIVHKHFDLNYPTSKSASIETDLILVNSNPAFSIVKPNIPQVVEFGAGVHIQPEQPLPKHIKEFLDGDLPVVYFSFGSNVLGKYMPSDMTIKLTRAFSKLPAKILWKYEDELTSLPPNVMIVKWAPQQDILSKQNPTNLQFYFLGHLNVQPQNVQPYKTSSDSQMSLKLRPILNLTTYLLGHPNVKAFIMQCGYQSMEEALYTGVPIVGIPFYGDQLYNSRIIESTQIGVVLSKDEITEDSLSNAVLEVIQNPKYKENQLRLAKISKDQPIYGIEKAVWWIEYVLRNKGARHLRCSVADLSFYQYYMLDVIGFIALVVSFVAYVTYRILRFSIRFCRRLNPIKEKSI